MRLRTSFILFLLLLSSILFSANVLAFDSIFNDYVYTLDTFKVGDDVFTIKALADNNMVLVLQKNDEQFFIQDGTCEDTAFYQYCFLETKLDYMDYGQPIPNTLEWEPAINLQIFSKKPLLSVSRSVTGEINVDEDATVTVTVKNDGELDVNDLVFKEVIPPNVIVKSMNNRMVLNNRVLTWTNPFLKSKKEISFTYSISPKTYESIVLNDGMLSYSYDSKNYFYELSSSTIKINSPYSITTSLDKTSPKIGESFIYTKTFKNEDWNDRLFVNLDMVIPDKVEITAVSGNINTLHKINYDFSLSPGESETVQITLKGDFKGYYAITSNATLNIRDEVTHDFYQQNFTIIVPELIPQIVFLQSEVLDDSEFKVTAYMTNPTLINFHDLSAVIQIPGYETRKLSYDIIKPGEKLNLFNDTFPSPNVEEKTSLDVTFRGSYKSPASDYITFETTNTISIIPTTIGFFISKTIDKTEVYPGDNLTVSVNVKNTGQKSSYVNVYEKISSPLKVISGLTSRNLTVKADEEKEFYIYKLNVPQNTTPGDYSLKTILDFENENLTNTKEVNITVKQQPVEEINESINVTTPEIQTTIEKELPKEKETIVDVIINFFIGLFK